MKCPINPEIHLKEVSYDMETTPGIEAFVRSYVNAINDAYYAGRDGKPGYPMDADVELEKRSKRLGITQVDSTVRNIYQGVITLINEGYAQGVRDAKAEVA